MKFIHTEYSKNSVGHYTPAVVSGNTVYISGQIPLNPETGKTPEGIVEQTKQTLINVDRVLKAAGLTRENVVMCHVYITDFAYWGEVNTVYREFFGDHRPARIMLPVGNMKERLVEIEAIAEMN